MEVGNKVKFVRFAPEEVNTGDTAFTDIIQHTGKMLSYEEQETYLGKVGIVVEEKCGDCKVVFEDDVYGWFVPEEITLA